MSKVILVSKHIDSTCWSLALALKAQQHQVVLLSSYGEVPPQSISGIEIMSYFRRWSALEGLRIIPGLFGLQPQILHLLLDDDKMNAAQIILSTFARSHPTCVLTTSLLHIRFGLTRRNPVRYLIEESDIITCPTVESLGHLRGLNVRSPRQGRGILPPVLDLQNSISDDGVSDEDFISLMGKFTDSNYVVIPFREQKFLPLTPYFQRIQLLASKYNIVLWGSYSHWSLRDRKKFATWMEQARGENSWTLTGFISSSHSKIFLAKSKALILAGQSFSPLEITEYYLRALQNKATVVIDSVQSSVHAGLWQDGRNCWILKESNLNREFSKLLAKSNLSLPQDLTIEEANSRHLIDSSLNELNRLYNRALNNLR